MPSRKPRLQAVFTLRCYTGDKEITVNTQLISGKSKAPVRSALLLAASILLLSGASFAAKSHTKLTQEQAKQIALKKEAGTVQSGELEKEKGRWIYSFDIQTGSQVHEVNVDANTGAVVEDSVEDPAAEAREKAQEAKHAKVSPK
jgi:uncharacterized membrane protein YkoI